MMAKDEKADFSFGVSSGGESFTYQQGSQKYNQIQNKKEFEKIRRAVGDALYQGELCSFIGDKRLEPK